MADWKNKLYFGDNLDILREHVLDESVDLIYLDPPFNSNATYNVLFKEASGESSAAQIQAFDDTWHWDLKVSESAYRDVVTHGPKKLADLLQAMRSFLGQNDMMAYLTMMAQRMTELHRVLKPTGSIYLHCDPTASHYLKLVMDSVFGPREFRSEIIWRRSNAHNKISRQFGPIHDTLLLYGKSDRAVFHPGVRPHYKRYITDQFGSSDANGPYRVNEITGAGERTGDSGKPWNGIDITAKGRHWAIPRALTDALGIDPRMLQHDKLDALAAAGDIVISASGFPRYKQRPTSGVPFQDIWAYQPYTEGLLVGTEDGVDHDVKWLENEDERLGYPTQKPEALLERIIQASSNEGDVVLDPFCGCGTAVAVAERLKRRWIGIDITHLAISLMKSRLHDTFGTQLSPYDVVGAPQDVESAKALATDSQHDGRYQFEYWALGLVDARPGNNRRKGADAGVDGLHQLLRRRLRQGEDGARAGQERPRAAEHHRHAQGGHGAREGGARVARNLGAAEQTDGPGGGVRRWCTCRNASRTASSRACRLRLSRTC